MNATHTRIGAMSTPPHHAPTSPRAAQAESGASLGPVLDTTASTVDLISDAARLAYDTSLKDAASVGEALGAALHAVEDTYASAVRTAHGACDALVDSVEGAYDTVATGLEDAADAVSDGLAAVADTVDNAVGTVAGYAVGGLKMAGAVLNLQA